LASVARDVGQNAFNNLLRDTLLERYATVVKMQDIVYFVEISEFYYLLTKTPSSAVNA
jgi:hypothetical protein